MKESASATLLQLRSFSRSQAKSLITEFGSAAELRSWSGNYFRFPLDLGQLRKHLKAHRANKAGILYSCYDGRIKDWVGYAELTRMTINRSAFLARVMIRKRYRRRGYAVPFVRMLAHEAFERHGLHRLELNVHDQNHVAIECYKRAGFEVEGLLRDVLIAEKGYWSELRMALLAPDFRAGAGSSAKKEKN